MDYIDYLKDLEKGEVDITPDDLAPEYTDPVTAGGSPYVEERDPEVFAESQTNKEFRLQERKRLVEASRGERISAYAATTKNPTYAGFMDSDFSSPKDTEKGFNTDLKWLQNNGYIGTGKKFGNAGGKGYSGTGEVRDTKKKGHTGPYDAEKPKDYEAGQYSKQVTNLTNKYGSASLKSSADEIFQDVFNIVKNIITRKTDKIHAVIYGDPGIGKTYEVMETCKRYMSQSPTKAKYCYEAGDIGSSMSSLVPFFYKHSQNEVIVLDDNDKMIMKGLSQDIMNIMKALMDPKAATDKPVTVRANMLKIFGDRLADLEEDPLKESYYPLQNRVFEVDAEALRENVFILSIDGEQVINKRISLRETQEIQNSMMQLRETEPAYVNPYARNLREAEMNKGRTGLTNKELLDDLIGGDEPDEYEGMSKEDIEVVKSMKKYGATEQGADGGSFPRRFLFNSSVIFISNLEMDDINTAVLDRTESVEVKLNLDQFLERLASIYKALGKVGMNSQVDPKIRDWSKKCIFTVIGILIEAWKSNMPVFGAPIEINRKLTFRMFDEFVSAWERYAMDASERIYGQDLVPENKAYLDKLSIELVPTVIRRKAIPFLKTVVKLN